MQTREKLILATVLVRTATAALELKAMPDARRRRLAARKALHARQAAALQKAIIGAVSPVFKGMLTEVADRLAAIDATKEAMTSWRNPFKGFDPSQPRDEAGRWAASGAETVAAAQDRIISSGLADEVDLGGMTNSEASAVADALAASLVAGDKKLKLRSIAVKLKNGWEDGGLGYSNGHITITPKFAYESARNHNRESALIDGLRSYAWQDAGNSAEALALAVAHEVGHHLETALLLDTYKAARETGADLSEAVTVNISGYATTHPAELFAETHSYMTMGRQDMVPPGVQAWYKAALETADPEPIAVFMRKGFDPGQPRDEAGRWTQTGAGPQPEPTAEEAKARKELTSHLEMVAGFMKPPEGFKYASTEQLVLENGQFDTPAPVPSGVPKGQQKLCFMNAFQLATSHPDKYTYVEGYAHPGFMPLPIHHAWVVDNQGKVIDNTWETPGDAYFGVHMPLKFIMQRADKTGVYGVFGGYGDSRDLYKDGLPQSAKKSVKVFCPTGPGGGIDPTCKPGQTASGFTVGGTVQIAGRDVSLEYDETLTSPDTIRLAAKWINGVPPRALQDSTVRRICIYDNAEDVTRKLEELGISPDEGMANGAYDFATGTVYAAVWDGYEDSPRTLFHELGHSVVGYDEDAAENWARIYMPGMGEWQGGKSTEPCRIPAGNPGGGQFAPCTGEGGLPLLAHVEITRGAHHFGGVSNKIFGRIVTEEEVAAVAGAIDDAEVEINVTQSRIYVDIKHPKYEASRIIGMAGVHNSSFEVKGKRGGGVGTTVFASQVKHAAAMGLESISTEAVGSSGDPDYNGYYTWARLGYDARLDTTSVSMGRLRANFPDAEKISDLMKTPEGRTYWKENGGGFSGIFDLREGSQSRKVLDAYVAAKTKGTPGTKSTEPCRVPAGSSEGGQFSACNSGDFGDIELTSFGKTDSQPGPKMDNAEFEYLVSRRLGRPVTAEQIARAAGAMPGAKVKISAGYDEVKVTINHKDYDCIREFNIKDKWIENAYFAAQETGKGIGTDVFASQVKAAAELGFKDIVTTATGEYGDEDYNGYYTWPRLGYDTEIYNLPQKRSINREFPEAKSLSDLMKTPEGRSWWKQNGTTFRAVFDLNEGSQSRKVLDAYVAAKQARATAGTKSGGRSNFGSGVGRFGQKSAADNARALTAQILDAKKWTTRLVDAIFPVLARGMGEAAWAELLQTGAEIPATKATTATEWLQQHGLTAPPGVLTEWPPWLIKAIEEELSNAFSEDYWEEIVDVTTRDDIETVIADGLQNGSSIRDLSDAIRETLGGDYYHGRSKNIAITEAGNALNGGRMRGIQALAEELGPEVPLRAVWLSILSNTTRDTHANLDGVPANEDGMWWLGGMWVPWPGYFGLPPGERCNCYCTVVSEFGLDDASASQLIAQYQQRIADYEAGTGEFAEGKAFCPTGPGGGIDNSCPPGGGAATAAPVVSLGDSKEARKKLAAVVEKLTSGGAEMGGSGVVKATLIARGKLKQAIASKLEESLLNDYGVPPESLKKFVNDYGNGNNQKLASQIMLDAWASCSGNGNSVSVALQMVVKEKFKLEDATNVVTANDASLRRARGLLEDHGEVVRAFADATYDHTQSIFEDAGVEKITLYRGMILGSKPEGNKATLQPLSSFAVDYVTAATFANDASYSQTAAVIAVEVPVSKIFSSALSGIGCLTESEMIVMGGEYNAKIVAEPGNVSGTSLPQSEEDFWSTK